MAARIGVIGSGAVGEALADAFLSKGHPVMRGSRDPAKLAAWRQRAGAQAAIGTDLETARYGEIVVLAVKGTAAEAAALAVAPALAGKVVIDPGNPIADAPPQDGVLRYFTGPNESLLERLQAAVPAARWVKAFSCVGSAHMVDPAFGAVKPTMFICGDDAAAKATVTEILTRFGWDTADMGTRVAARAIEPLAMLWCIPGIARNQWNHAFALLRKG